MNPDITALLLEHLAELLPRIAAEGEQRERVAREKLVDSLKSSSLAATEVVAATMQLAEAYFAKMGWLDAFERQSGHWQFVSYPASLAARSWLAVMSDPSGCWHPPGWWSDEANTEEMRRLLREMEELRLGSVAGAARQAIRMVYVAWALLKIEGRFLFCEREDRERPGVAHHVPTGGRLNLSDLKRSFPGEKIGPCLAMLQNHDSREAHRALVYTLAREIEEETGLKPGHYRAGEALRLKPYFKLEGAGANHAYTRYEIDLFPLELNFEGIKQIFRMESLMDTPEYPLNGRLSWFTPGEVARSQKQDQRAFIDAWHAHYGHDAEALQKDLLEYEESYTDHSLYHQKTDFPLDPEEPFKTGETSNERLVFADLDRSELQILAALAWRRKFGWKHPVSAPESLLAHRLGWVEAFKRDLRELLVKIQEKLQNAGLPLLESHNRTWFRVSLDPEKIFFHDDLFTFELLKPVPDRWELALYAGPLETPIGFIREFRFACQLTEKRYRFLKSVADGAPSGDIFSEPSRELRKTVDPFTQGCGMRKLVRTVDKDYHMFCSSRLDLE